MLKFIPCQLYRGGTSKGLFFLESDLPPAGEARDNLLLRVMGSPDVRQIDGLGGASSMTSKVAIVRKSADPDRDVDYTFGQVSLDEPLVSYDGNCGNVLSAVGAYAIDNGLVPAREGETLVRVYNTNTRKIIDQYIPVCGGQVQYDGDFHLPGVPGTSSEIRLCFRRPAGAVTGRLLPAGSPCGTLEVPGLGEISVSIVDCANPVCFVLAKEVGMRGTELPEEIDGDGRLLDRLESIRAAAAVRLGFLSDPARGRAESPTVPKLVVLSPAAACSLVSGGSLLPKEADITCRMMSMQRAHRTYAFSAALCTAAAAAIPGTLVQRLCSPRADGTRLRIAHTDGVMTAGVTLCTGQGGAIDIESAYGVRTARRLFSGLAYYR